MSLLNAERIVHAVLRLVDTRDQRCGKRSPFGAAQRDRQASDQRNQFGISLRKLNLRSSTGSPLMTILPFKPQKLKPGRRRKSLDEGFVSLASAVSHHPDTTLEMLIEAMPAVLRFAQTIRDRGSDGTISDSAVTRRRLHLADKLDRHARPVAVGLGRFPT